MCGQPEPHPAASPFNAQGEKSRHDHDAPGQLCPHAGRDLLIEHREADRPPCGREPCIQHGSFPVTHAATDQTVKEKLPMGLERILTVPDPPEY